MSKTIKKIYQRVARTCKLMYQGKTKRRLAHQKVRYYIRNSMNPLYAPHFLDLQQTRCIDISNTYMQIQPYTKRTASKVARLACPNIFR